MTDHSFERIVAESLSSVGVPAPSDGAIERTVARVGQKRQRPEWLALIKEPTMHSDSRLTVGSPTARVAAVLAATLLLGLVLAGAGIAGARLLAADGTIIVAQDGSGDFGTITEAVATAEDGDTILVRPGTYAESVTVDRDITMKGDGERNQIVISVDQGPVMTIAAGRPSFSGFTFHGPTSAGVQVTGGSPRFEDLEFREVGPSAEAGGCVRCRSLMIAGSSATVRDSRFTDGGSISVEAGANAIIEDNVLTGGPAIALLDIGDSVSVKGNVISGTLDRAIGVFGPGTPTISGNVISEPFGDAITIDWGGVIGEAGPAGVEPIISDNEITGARTGINVLGLAVPSIVGNRIERSGTGIVVSHDASALIDGNLLVDNGIGMTVRSDVRIESNEIEGGTAGIVVTSGPSESVAPVLSGNTVEEAERGIILGRNTRAVLIDNHVCRNGTNLVVDPSSEPTMQDNDICADALTDASG